MKRSGIELERLVAKRQPSSEMERSEIELGRLVVKRQPSSEIKWNMILNCKT